jgi:hypothetical protein
MERAIKRDTQYTGEISQESGDSVASGGFWSGKEMKKGNSVEDVGKSQQP